MSPYLDRSDALARFHRALVEASGGTSSLIKRTEQALRDNQPQLVLELTDIVFAIGSFAI